MNTSLNWLVTASIINLAGNTLGTVIAVNRNLAAGLGNIANSNSVIQDFLGLKGTALSGPLSFMLLQLLLTIFALRPNLTGKIGVGGLTFLGLFYTLAQIGEPIVLRQFSGGFELTQSVILLVNIVSAIGMLVFGIMAWRAMRTARSVTVN